MKELNINAVRTSRYSPMDPYFYQLCDEMGLYVVCDANLLPTSTQQHAVATDKDFIPMFVRRVENLYGKFKNYTSIVAWSLGESRDNGICMGAAYKRLKELDVPCEMKYDDPKDFHKSVDTLDMSTSNPKIMTFHSAKGLQFETIFIPWITDNPLYMSLKISISLWVNPYSFSISVSLSSRSKTGTDCSAEVE